MEHVGELNPSSERVDQARTRFLHTVRAISAIERESVARPFVTADPHRLEGFRRLLALKESDPSAAARLAEIVTIFDPQVQERLRRVAVSGSGRPFRSVQEWVASQSYRHVHSAALGAGAAGMWRFGREPDALWRHGNAVGILAVSACYDAPALRDHAFAAGLLHNLGRIALTKNQGRRSFARVLSSEGPDNAHYAEALGREIARSLEIPDDVVENMLPCGLSPREATTLSQVVGAACDMAHRLGFIDQATRDPDPAPDTEAQQRVNDALAALGGRPRVTEHISALMVAAQDGAMSVWNTA